MSEVFGVLQSALPTQWPQLLPWIERGLEAGHGEYSPADIRALAEAGKVQLWAYRNGQGVEAVAASQLATYPGSMVGQMILMGGRDGVTAEWLPWLRAIENWSGEQGASAFEVIGRKGWQRRLEPLGYKLSQIVMRKELT